MRLIDFFKRKKKNSTKNLKNVFFKHIFGSGDYTLENSDIIFAAVSRLANTISCIPVKLYKNADEITDDPRSDLIQYCPNGKMSSLNFFKCWETCRCSYGNGYVLKVVDGYEQVCALEILDPTRVKPCIDAQTEELWYRVNLPEGSFYIHNYYIMHTRFISTNGIEGINPIKVLFNTLDYSSKMEKLNIQQLEKGINNAVVIEAPANLGDEQRDRTIDTFMQAYKKSGGAVLLLESGLKASALQLSPVDTKMMEQEKINRSKVSTVYNIPPHLIGDYSASALGTAEQQMLEYNNMTILPIIRMYEQELDRGLLTLQERQQGYHFRFNISELLRGDTKTRAEANFKMVRSATKSPNEARREEGLAPTSDGDSLLVSKDLIPLDLLIKKIEKELEVNDTDE